jgi:hypothetical protein
MIGSRNEVRACIARGLFGAWAGLIAAVAYAETPGETLGPPISLLPPSVPVAVAPGSAAEEPVASEPLAPPAPGWSAAAAPRDALPVGFWRGTPRAVAELLLARLPDTSSPTLQSLERRLLLSPAAAPEGADEPGRNLPALRAAALLRLGELDAARAVLAEMPKSDRGRALPLAVAADAIGGEVERACATVRDSVRRDQAAFWQIALIACQALHGETEQASLGLQILGEEHAAGDAALAAAVDALAGRHAAAAVSRADRLDPLTLRLLVKARQSLAPGLVETLPPDLALCLALDEETPAATRLVAAERAALFGALPADRLRALYSALSSAGQPSDRLDHATRLAAIPEATTAAERLRRIAAFANALGGPNKAGFALAARLVLPILRDIAPDPSLGASAPIAARLLIAAGDGRAARGWVALVPGSEGASLRLLLGLATGDEEATPEHPQTPLSPLVLALFAALGEPLGSAEWTRLPEAAWTVAGPPSAPPAAWLDLAEAAAAKRIGETVLGAILVAAASGPLTTDPVSLFTAVSGLKRIGLDADARRLAVESALAAGL